jgi:Co/Zn/Cd efflux system component
MIIVASLALVGNAVCLWLIQKTKRGEAHMEASYIFTSNDIIINFGVIVSGVLVYLTATRWPDLIVGSIVFAVVLRGAFRILKLSK